MCNIPGNFLNIADDLANNDTIVQMQEVFT